MKAADTLWTYSEGRAEAPSHVLDVKCERMVKDYSRVLAEELLDLGQITRRRRGGKNQECN